jgi:hypothetical protein
LTDNLLFEDLLYRYSPLNSYLQAVNYNTTIWSDALLTSCDFLNGFCKRKRKHVLKTRPIIYNTWPPSERDVFCLLFCSFVQTRNNSTKFTFQKFLPHTGSLNYYPLHYIKLNTTIKMPWRRGAMDIASASGTEDLGPNPTRV